VKRPSHALSASTPRPYLYDLLMRGIANDKQLLTVREAADRLRVHPVTLRHWIADGRVPAVQLGGPGKAVRLDSDELDRWVYGPSETDAA
jgi:excisionase family DNA binding protein